MYRNGVVVYQAYIGRFRAATAYDLYIGNRPGGDSFYTFPGKIDELSIYSRPLTTDEIIAIYDASVAGKCDFPVEPTCAEAPSGLLSWWRANGTSDDSAGLNYGVLNGNVSFTNGAVGSAFLLSGNGAAVQVGNATNLHVQSFTIETWIKRSSPTVTSLSFPDADLFAFGLHGYGFGIFANGDLYLTKIGIDHVTVNTGIEDTSWHHVAITKNGSLVTFYVDGIAYPAPAYDPTFVFNTPAAIGARGDSLWNSFYGSIDEMAVYGRALAESEIKAIHASGSLGKCLTNQSPVAGTDEFSTELNTPAVFAVSELLLNDSDPEGNTLSVLSVSPSSSQGGTVILQSGTVTYTPAQGFVGIDTFPYLVVDGHGGGSYGTVIVTVGNNTTTPLNVVFGPTVILDNFVVNFAGIPGLIYTIEAAPEVEGPWTKLQNITAPIVNVGNGAGVFQIVEPVGTNITRFYRAVHPAY